jgi:glycosyltransferase 2 family protein
LALPNKLGRRLFASVVFGLLVYVGMAIWTDLRGVGAVLRSLPLWTLPAACGLSLLNYALRFLKWQRYLHLLEIRVPLSTSILIYLSGLVMSITPGKMGEVFKSWLLRKVNGTRIHHSAPIVVAERFTDLLGYLILVVIGGLRTMPEYAWMFWAMLGLCLLGLFLVSSPAFARGVVGGTARMPWIGRLAPRLEGSFQSARLLLAPREVILPTLVSVLGWGAECTGFWLIANTVVPDSLPYLYAVFAYAFSAVTGAVLIIFPGGLGVTEFSLGRLVRLRLSDMGYVREARGLAAGIVILTRLCTLWFAVLIGLLATAAFKRRFGEVEESEGATSAADSP